MATPVLLGFCTGPLPKQQPLRTPNRVGASMFMGFQRGIYLHGQGTCEMVAHRPNEPHQSQVAE